MELKQSAIIAACEALPLAVDPADMEAALRAFASEGGYSITETPPHPMSEALDDLRDLKSVLDAETTRLLRKGDADWESFYHRVFGVEPQKYKQRAKDTLAAIGWSHPDYYDPDTSYKDDVLAWVGAFEDVFKELEAVNSRRLGQSR
jgi:hypothetical protein